MFQWHRPPQSSSDQAQDTVQAGAHAGSQAAASTTRMSLAIRGLADLHRVCCGSGPQCRCRWWMHRCQTRWSHPAGRNTANTRSSMASPSWTHPRYSHSHTDTKKGQGKGRIDGQPMHFIAEEHEPQHHQHQVDDPIKPPTLILGNRSANPGWTGGSAAEGEVVGVLEMNDAHGGEDRTEVEFTKKFKFFSRFCLLNASLNCSWGSSI